MLSGVSLKLQTTYTHLIPSLFLFLAFHPLHTHLSGATSAFTHAGTITCIWDQPVPLTIQGHPSFLSYERLCCRCASLPAHERDGQCIFLQLASQLLWVCPAAPQQHHTKPVHGHPMNQEEPVGSCSCSGMSRMESGGLHGWNLAQHGESWPETATTGCCLIFLAPSIHDPIEINFLGWNPFRTNFWSCEWAYDLSRIWTRFFCTLNPNTTLLYLLSGWFI